MKVYSVYEMTPRDPAARSRMLREAFKDGFFNGLSLDFGAGALMYEPTDFPPLEGSDADRLRGDWERVGQDMARAMESLRQQYEQG